MRPRISALLLALVAFAATPAGADENGPPGLWTSPTAPAPAEPRERRFYGWQLIPVDLVSVALMTVVSGDAGKVGAATYLTTGLVFHTVHGNAGNGFMSVVFRGGLPLLGGAVGGVAGALSPSPSCSGGGDWDCNDGPFLNGGGVVQGAVIGALTGVGCALALDWFRLSWTAQPAAAERSILAPQVNIDEQGLSLGVLGRF
jgi:hypothetical protein